jgi:methyltransferase (TIGR00027 family)
MAKESVSRTALGTAICRLIEQYQPEKVRLFNDPVAKELVGQPIKSLMGFAAMRNLTMRQTDAVAPGIYGVQICRTRYIDEAVNAAISQGIKQLVLLGAGYDTRPYRLPRMESIRVFEVDLATVQEDKKKKLRKCLGRLPGNITYMPLDFERQPMDAALVETAFDRSRPAVFVWEGVSQYITEEAARATLAFVGKSAAGSLLVFTYVLRSVIERRSNIPSADHLMDVVAKQSPWVFGLEPSGLADYLKPLHLGLIADVGNADYQEKFLKPIGRNLVVFEGERIVQAKVD